MDNFRWYILTGGERVGPLSEPELRQRVRDGGLNRSTLVWREGLAGWVRDDAVPGLLAVQPPEPPPPPTVPEPAEFDALYDRIFKITIPVTVIGVLLPLFPQLPREISVLSYFTSLVTLIVLSNMLLYKAWALIQDGHARTTPGKAVGFRFIPFFSFYWEFVAIKGLAEDLNAYARRREIVAPAVSTELALSYCLLFVVGKVIPLFLINAPTAMFGEMLGLPAVILGLLVMQKLAKSCKVIAASLRQETLRPGATEGPQLLNAVVAVLDQVEKIGKSDGESQGEVPLAAILPDQKG